MLPRDDDAYILGTHDGELVRLGFQHRLWSAEAVGAWQRAGFRIGQTIVDLGCGPGYATLDLAELVGPEGQVIGVDASSRFVHNLESRCRALGVEQVHGIVADAGTLQLEPESIDGCWARWLLCFVRDPEAVVRTVAAALRPGGAFVVFDYFNQQRAETIAPRDPAFDAVFAAIGESWRTRGGDPDIGGRVPRLFEACGLAAESIVPHVRVGRPGSLLWDWIGDTVLPFLPTLVELGLITPAQRSAYEDEWRRRSADPTSFFCTPPILEIIGRKP